MKKILLLLVILLLFSCDGKNDLSSVNNEKEKEEITKLYKEYFHLWAEGLKVDSGRLIEPEYNKRASSTLKLEAQTFLNKLERSKFKNEKYEEILDEIVYGTKYIENFSEYSESNSELMVTDYIDTMGEINSKINGLSREAGLEIN